MIGGVFLLIVLFSPDGLLGLWDRLRAAWNAGARAASDAVSITAALRRTLIAGGDTS